MIPTFKEEWLDKRIWKLTISEYIIIIITLLYGIIFSYYTILKHFSFRSNAWDLGLLVQSIASATKGQFFINNVERYYSITGSYFGVHFAPILFAILPFFYLVPKVETILVVQAFALALGAIPVYLIARLHFKRQLPALLISATYLLSPSLQGINWYDFHTQAFFPFFILSATYFLKKRKSLMFLICIILSLTTLEQASYLVAVYSIYAFWEVRKELKESIFQKRIKLFTFIPIIVIVIVISWIVFSNAAMQTINPNPPQELKALSNYEILDVKEVAEIPTKVITNPDLALKAIRFDFPRKILYIMLTFAPSGFISLLSPFALLPSVPWLVLSILSNHAPYYELGFQYSAFALPFITIATIEALGNLSDSMNEESTRRILKKVSILLLAFSVILTLFVTPLSFIFKPGNYEYFRDYGISYPTFIDKKVDETLKLIPKDSLVITTSTIFPHLSTDTNAYVLPSVGTLSPRLYSGNLEYLKTIGYDYIFLTYFWDRDVSDTLYQEFVKGDNAYGLLVKGAGLELYKKGYTGSPTKLALKFTSNELALTNQSIVVEDASSQSGNVILFKPSSVEGTNAWFGPYVTFTPGNYTANFRIKFDSKPGGRIMVLDVASLGTRIASREIFSSDITQTLAWFTFSITFNVVGRASNIEFRGLDVAANVGLSLDNIEVVPL